MTVRRAVLAVLVPGAAVLVALHVSRIAERLRYPYDLILWGDDYFMTSMAKLAAGVPLYGPLADANSTVYAPGGAWLHHALLAPFHLDTSLHANRVLTLCWLTLALAVGTFTVSKLSRRRDGALESRVDESLSAALAFLVLALVALSNPVVDSLHPTDLELLVLSSSLAVLAAWRELSPGRRLVANVLLPAAAVLSKQTAGLAVTGALAAASFLDAEGPIARRLRASVVPVLSLAVVLGAVQLGTRGGFFLWGFSVLGHHPFDWWKVNEFWSGHFLIFLPVIAVAVGSAVVLRGDGRDGAVALRRASLLPLAYAPPALAALFKRFGGTNNLAVLGYLCAVVALPVLLGPLRTWRAEGRTPRGDLVAALFVALLVGQAAVLHTRKRVPSALDYENAETICAYTAARMRCGEKVHLGRGVVCYQRGGVAVPIDRINSIAEVSEAGMRDELAFFGRVTSEYYDVLAIPMTDLLFLKQDFWKSLREHYAAFFQTSGELENDFWYDGWQGYVSWPVVFFERNREKGRHHVSANGMTCE